MPLGKVFCVREERRIREIGAGALPNERRDPRETQLGDENDRSDAKEPSCQGVDGRPHAIA
jgi:hypothetical protein